MVARNREHGPVEAAQEARRARELILSATMAQVTARDHELRREPLDQHRRAALDRVVVTRAVMQVGQVQNARNHGRSRL